MGSVVDIRCEDDTTRIEYDKYDEDPTDYKMSFVCTPTKTFNLPVYDWHKEIYSTYPRCSGWCPKRKPQPPNNTGLYLSYQDQNSRYV